MEKKVILITGCSSGIGMSAAATLHNRGHRVFATCRRDEDLQKLIAMGLQALLLDVNDSDSIERAFSKTLQLTQGRLDVLINNAGYGQAGALEDIRRDVMRKQFETNVFGLLELSNLAIPVMRRQGAGRIINISSILGLIGMPFRGAYNASKFAVEGLCDTMRLELKASGIKVITVEPGPIESRFRDTCVDYSLKNIDMEHSHFAPQYQKILSGYKQAKMNSKFTKSSHAVVEKLVHAVESTYPKTRYPVTFPAYLLMTLKRLLPVILLDRFLLKLSAHELN